MAMVDTGATHTFIDVNSAAKLGLKLTKSPSYVKTVNAKAQAIVGMTYGVSMSTGNWVGKHNLMVMPLGDFEMILGIDFLRKFQFVPFSHLDGIMIMNRDNAEFVKGVHSFGKVSNVVKKKDRGMMLFAMSIGKGMKRVPDCVAKLLKKFADVMPLEVPKTLPPRREIDHKIELLPGTVGPAQVPYRMDPKELVELRKQLNELLDAGLIQPYKAPYGAPVLFQKKQDGTMRMLRKACWFTKLDLRQSTGSDDIVIYSRTLDEHVNHLNMVKDLRSFLGLANYYRKFIAGYSKRAAALTDLLKKDAEWIWALPDFELPFEVHTDASDKAIGGVSTFFKTQKKLSPKQARWQEFLAEYDFMWEHKPGKHNQVADALSRKEVFAAVYSISKLETDFFDRIRERIVVPNQGGMRKDLMKEEYDSAWVGHSGVERMLALLSRVYFWPKMEDDIEAYVKTCHVCQVDKNERKKEASLLQPLRILEMPWLLVSMDFNFGFPKVDSKASIMVIVDRFSKYFVFIVAPELCSSEIAADLFYKYVVKYFGVPSDIVSDRDTKFTGRFWTALFNMMGIELKFSTANHPQTDGQTKRISHLLEEYLRHYVTVSQQNWVALLDTAQFCYTLLKSSVTEMSPFEIVLGKQSTTTLNIASKTRHRGLIPRYDGPFEVVKRVGEVAYRNRSKRAPPSVPTQFDAEIEKILDHRVLGTSKKNTKIELLIHWKGKSAANAVWEKSKDLWQFDA
ncbi:uncharacterized protein LOC107027726 [Solanum pennellii]|uniref:Uncharacterized protein LOC107027726 n=1 Tax=Solanum pennellii TaxID=28526 RepID=A0ABM1HEA6_SOLPN|nr:uncharacterized protein LOC107027726 [Solanum pennellii]